MYNSTVVYYYFFFFSSRRRHTRLQGDWSSDVCSSDLDAEAVTAALTMPVVTAWQSDDNGSVFYGGKEARDIQLVTASERYFDIKNLRIAVGRPFTAQENRSGVPVAVLGDAVAKRLFVDRTPLERSVRIGGIAYRVIGVVEKQGSVLGFPLAR